MNKLDTEFCRLCIQDGREWDSGSTALIATLIDEHLIIANLGDARAIVGRSVDTSTSIDHYMNDGWNELPPTDTGGTRRCLWKEVTKIHSPNRDDERQRIEHAGGWVTTEREIPVAQLKRMELDDKDVVDILHRCLADRQSCTTSSNSGVGGGRSTSVNCITSNKASAPHRVLQIARVCGILGVSRAIGDRELKASSYNGSTPHCHGTDDPMVDSQSPPTPPFAEDEFRWDSSHLGLMYPEGHDRHIVGNLISNQPEFQLVKVGEVGVYDEFLLLACDGLWDVLDPDDAYRITRDLLFVQQWSTRETAARLAELALHLGSSDNVTVLIVRFFFE
jgi:serine/threonine protein phosphatase PrpC